MLVGAIRALSKDYLTVYTLYILIAYSITCHTCLVRYARAPVLPNTREHETSPCMSGKLAVPLKGHFWLVTLLLMVNETSSLPKSDYKYY